MEQAVVVAESVQNDDEDETDDGPVTTATRRTMVSPSAAPRRSQH